MKIDYRITEQYKELIKHKHYEKIVCELINKSKKLFPHNYILVKDQSHGEPDFIDEVNNDFFDAKLLFDDEICKNINIDYFESWLSSLKYMINEVYDCIMINDSIRSCLLYQKMLKELKKIEDNENCILFFPFAITTETEESYINEISVTIFEHVFLEIIENESEITKNKIYMIYPGIFGDMIIKDLRKHEIEFIKFDTYKYIDFVNLTY